jgi:hypothetical protein
MSIQATMNAFKDKIENRVADEVEQKFDEIASYAVYVAVPDQSIDTGAYVTSFSIGKAGFGGGRSRSSDNKPKNQNPQAMKDQAYSQLIGDIDRIDFKAVLESGDARFTLKNRAPHARDVEDGTNWRRSGYHVFAKIRNQFG